MAKINAEKAQSKGEQTRAALIEAAYELFRERGYAATSMRQIAERADLALGGIYNHFASKEEIFAAVLETYHPYRKIMPAFEQVVGETVDAFVRDAARRIQNEVEDFETKLLPLMFIELVEFQGRHLAKLLESIMPGLLSFVQKFGERQGKLRPVPVPVMLRMLAAIFVGYMLTELVLRNVPLFKDNQFDWFDGMIDIYLNGILDPA
jgi:AcrR family transcriptional regulator